MYLDQKYVMQASSLSEVYWEALESHYNTRSNLITTFRGALWHIMQIFTQNL